MSGALAGLAPGALAGNLYLPPASGSVAVDPSMEPTTIAAGLGALGAIGGAPKTKMSSSSATFAGDIRVGGLTVNVPNYADPVFSDAQSQPAGGAPMLLWLALIAAGGYLAWRAM